MFTRSGSAHWEGGLKDGKGRLSTQSGALKDNPYGYTARFEEGAGTNPEELIGAAHAGCFSMALSMMLEQAGITGAVIDASSAVTLERVGDGVSITKAHLTVTVSANGDKAQIEDLVQKAKEGCAVSRLLNAKVTMEATVR